MGSITKPILLAVVGILAVVLFLQTSNLITGFASENMTAITQLGGANIEPSVFWVNVTMTAADQPCDNDTNVITCYGYMYDPNGADNITGVNGTLWSNGIGQAACDDIALDTANLSNCYFNSTCTSNTTVVGNGTETEYTCTFGTEAGTRGLTWYAANGTWNCTMWATDGITVSWNDSEGNGGNKNRAALYALDINTSINWGSVAVGNSSGVPNDVRNCGNRLQDTRVNATDMTCDGTGSTDLVAGNISVGLTQAVTEIPNMNATLQKLDTNHAIPVDGNDTVNRTTYWNITVPAGVSGNCNGTAVFNAIESY